jgi:hypothetical protein
MDCSSLFMDMGNLNDVTELLFASIIEAKWIMTMRGLTTREYTCVTLATQTCQHMLAFEVLHL